MAFISKNGTPGIGTERLRDINLRTCQSSKSSLYMRLQRQYDWPEQNRKAA